MRNRGFGLGTTFADYHLAHLESTGLPRLLEALVTTEWEGPSTDSDFELDDSDDDPTAFPADTNTDGMKLPILGYRDHTGETREGRISDGGEVGIQN